MSLGFRSAIAVSVLLATVPSTGQGTTSGGATEVQPADAAAVVAALRKAVRERYVLPETAARLDKALGAAERQRAFAGLRGVALAEKLNAVMQTVTEDGHLGVAYDPQTTAALARRPPERDHGAPTAEFARQVETANGGVQKLETLPGNIRYMDYRGFLWGAPAAPEALANAMRFLQGGDAVIIDLRRNGGGSPDAVAALASYFLPPATKLMRFEMRNSPGEASQTSATPFSLTGKPVYVLTSRSTFSAAEEFASHAAAFKFATLVGENTGGGGFRNEFVVLPGGFHVSISIGRAVHALTGRDWEAVGVAPAIATTAENALARAQAEAMTLLAAKAPPGERAAAERLALYYRAVATPVDPGKALQTYAGRYGDRMIALDAGGSLTTVRPGRPASRLVPIGPDSFAPEASPAQHFRFVLDGDKGPILEITAPGGEVQRSSRAG